MKKKKIVDAGRSKQSKKVMTICKICYLGGFLLGSWLFFLLGIINDYNDYIQDLLKAGKEGTYATQELTTTMLKGGGFKQSITVAGGISKINPGALPTGLEFTPGG